RQEPAHRLDHELSRPRRLLFASAARDKARADRCDRFLGWRLYRGGDGGCRSRDLLAHGAGRSDGDQTGARRDHGFLRGDGTAPSDVDDRGPRQYSGVHQDYGGQMTPDRFEAFEEARSETARIGWEPFMHNPSLPHLLRGLETLTLLVWGTHDKVVPRGCIDAYRAAITGAQVVEIEGA